MMTEGKDLLTVLWSGADVLRGKMDANEYKTYLLGLVFYKYLSDSYLVKVYDLLNDAKPDSLDEAQSVYEEAMKSDDATDLLEEIKNSMHYTLNFLMDCLQMWIYIQTGLGQGIKNRVLRLQRSLKF